MKYFNLADSAMFEILYVVSWHELQTNTLFISIIKVQHHLEISLYVHTIGELKDLTLHRTIVVKLP